MQAGAASITAQRVAAQRLGFERAPWSSAVARPEDDERLARDVAGDVDTSPSALSPYLAARTRFVDGVVVRALEGGTTQVVIAGAGYDGRALRYASEGVRWFELDHPDTQRDKLARLARLGVAVDDVGFVPCDFGVDPIAGSLHAAGLSSERPALVCCEGVAIYLDRAVLEHLLRELAAAVAPGSRLAITLSLTTTDPARREALRERVALIGEPVRTVLEPDDALAMVESCGWRRTSAASERAMTAGFWVLTRDGG